MKTTKTKKQEIDGNGGLIRGFSTPNAKASRFWLLFAMNFYERIYPSLATLVRQVSDTCRFEIDASFHVLLYLICKLCHLHSFFFFRKSVNLSRSDFSPRSFCGLSFFLGVEVECKISLMT